MKTVQKLFSGPYRSPELETKKLTDLFLSSGAIVACDPLAYFNPSPFLQIVPSGNYPVILHLIKSEERIAYAELQISDRECERWELAICEGQDHKMLKADEIFGYPVDAGLGCFMDVQTLELLSRHEKELEAQKGDKYISYYDDYLEGILYAPNAESNDYCVIQPYPEKQNNIAVFQSGYGDGFYATYIGFDKNRNPVKFVTEFIDILNA